MLEIKINDGYDDIITTNVGDAVTSNDNDNDSDNN